MLSSPSWRPFIIPACRFWGLELEQAAIIAYVTETCPGTNIVIGEEGIAPGDTFFIYDPDRNLPDKRQLPFATIVTHDYGDFDNASNLNRDGVFRLNVGVSRETFRSLFGVDGTYDFTALDQLMPHPVYGRQSWVCVLNPSAETFDRVKPQLHEAYEIAVKRLIGWQAVPRPGLSEEEGDDGV